MTTPAMPGSAVEISAAVRDGSVAAKDVLEHSLAMIEARDAELHAFVNVDAEGARAEAANVDMLVAAGTDPGPLAGVPVALKDNMCVRGRPTTCCSKILGGWHPPYDATVVERLRSAGAVMVGKTNMDEFAMGSSTEHSAFGATRNPWSTGRVPGGSSGGSTAAVAAGMVPVALGSDTGGSIRQPAAFCGVVGVKPTYGVVSRYGLVAFASSLDQIGPITTSVADAALMLEVIAGHDPRDSTSLDRPSPRLREMCDRGVDSLRVGVVKELIEGADPAIATAVRTAAEELAGLGAAIDEVSIPEMRHGLPAYYLIAPAEASSNLARYDGVRYGLRVDGDDTEAMNSATRAAGFGAEVKRRVMLGTFALSSGYYDAYYGQAQKRAHDHRPCARGRLRPCRRAARSNNSDARVRARCQDRRPSLHVPFGPLHGSLEPRRTSRRQHSVRSVARRSSHRGAGARAVVGRARDDPGGGCRRARLLGARPRHDPRRPGWLSIAGSGESMTGSATSTPATAEFEAVIGLEVHCELRTATKLFCGCKNEFGREPNTHICPVCLGLPGSLPVLNSRAVEYAMRIGTALNCEIRSSRFDRKNYFYPDMPKDYQITQYAEPINVVGVPRPAGRHARRDRAGPHRRGHGQDHPHGWWRPDPRRRLLARRLQPRRCPARGDRVRARHPKRRASATLRGGAAGHPGRDRRLRRAHGGRLDAHRRQCVGETRRFASSSAHAAR